MKTILENTFKSIVSDFGSIKRPDISVPSKYKQVCFVNLQINSPGAIASQEICTDSDNSLNYEPLVCAGWKTGRDNLYLLPDGSDAFNVGPITIKGKNWHCFRVVNSKIKMQMKSLGDKVELCDYTPTETSKTKC